MRGEPTPDYSMLLVNEGGSPQPQHPLPPGRRGIVTAATYGQGVQSVEVDVVSRSGPWLAVVQKAPEWPRWIAWVRAEQVQPVR